MTPNRGGPWRSRYRLFNSAQVRSASLRLLAKTMVDVWLSISSSTRGYTAGQIDLVLTRSGSSGSGSSGHVLDRDHQFDVQPPITGGVDQLDRPGSPFAVVVHSPSAEEHADGLEGPLSGREADPLRGRGGELGQPLQADRQMGAPLRAGDGVHLVTDDVADGAERLSGL